MKGVLLGALHTYRFRLLYGFKHFVPCIIETDNSKLRSTKFAIFSPNHLYVNTAVMLPVTKENNN